MREISYSGGTTIRAVIDVWDDLHNERSGYFRAYWVREKDGAPDPQVTVGSPVVGYCSPGGSHRTLRAVVAECARLYPGVAVYRNGRKVSR